MIADMVEGDHTVEVRKDPLPAFRQVIRVLGNQQVKVEARFAEKMVGSLLFVDEKDAIRLPKGTFFIHDVVGLKVVDEEENFVGIVKDVLKYPANDVYVIENEGKELLLPAVKEFVKKIDPAAKTMTVHLIEGMEQSSGADEEDTDAD